MCQKRLLLIIPPQKGLLKGFATGIVSLAEYLALKQNDINTDIEILDYSICSPDEVKMHSLDYGKDQNLIVGITTTTASYQSALYVAKNFKRSNAGCTVIFGGHHASADPENILRNHPGIVDYIITGEGEIALYEFMRDFPKIDNISNLVYLKDQKVIKNKIAPFLSEDDLNLISMSYKETELYGHLGKFETITYVSARGCPLKCSFCAVANQKMRAKSTHKVKEDIFKLVKRGFDTIAIEDNFFAHSPTRTFELCNELESLQKEITPFKWDCQTRVESLKNPDIIKVMEKAGCYAVYLGVEALNQEHLIYLGKAKNPDRYLELLFETVIPNMLTSNVGCYINLQLGIPGSNGSHHRQTMEALRKIGAMAKRENKSITVFPMLHVVYPGTKHYYDGVYYKTYTSDVFEYFTKWEATQTNLYGWLGENFAHGTGGIPQGILNAERLKENIFEILPDKILEIQNQLSEIKRIAGIKVFEYKPFIT